MIEGHGDDLYKYTRPIVANFSSNVYANADLSGLKAHLRHCLDHIGSYPEPEPYTLEARLASLYRLRANEVCVTNGATEAIYLIAQTFRPARAYILQPTFSEYADACRMHGHIVSALYSLPGEREGFLLPDDADLLWLCNPNNPTGSVVDKVWLEEVIRYNPRVCIVIDQSYESFTLRPLFTPAEGVNYPNVLLLHSMTKRYAIPGLRLGYVTGNEGLLSRLRLNRMPWSVNLLAIEAGLFLTGQEAFLYHAETISCLEEARWLAGALRALGGLEVWPTETHFMLVHLRMGGRASALKDYLAEKYGFLIRDASNFDGLDERFFRIATRGHEENRLLVNAIGCWLKEE